MDRTRNVDLGRILTHHASVRPRNIALTDGEGRFDFDSVNRRVNRLANALTNTGIRRGDRVAVRLANSHRYFECLFACAKVGAVMVPINGMAAPEELEQISEKTAASLLFDDEATFDSFSARAPETEPAATPFAEDPLLIMYTSGTTGAPKGAVLTHANIVYSSFNQILGWQLAASDRVLVVCPFHHVGGLIALGFPCLYAGGEVHLAQPAPDAILEASERERITALFLPPLLWGRLERDGAFDRANLASVRLCASGGDPIALPVLEHLIDRFQAEFTDAYGLTEASSCSTLLHGEDIVRRAGSAGKALAHNVIRVVNAEGREAPAGEIGEIVMTGPTVMKEYWLRPAETAVAIRDEWLWTGDHGRIDEEGFLYVAGRGSDVIVSGDAKIYPTEVERVLRQHAAVSEAAVIDIVDASHGRIVAAFVVPQRGMMLAPREIVDFCADRMAEFKRPKIAFVCDSLPRNGSGKVIRLKLRAILDGSPASG
ncbi:MAG TPA: AMP-binding protein [Candidatus Binataceae bacterium]|nr:AMP-binding protein [Candidatus Binataceae bacterium]